MVKFLDIAMPVEQQLYQMLSDSRTSLLVVLVILIIAAVMIVNRYILKKDRKEKMQETDKADEVEW